MKAKNCKLRIANRLPNVGRKAEFVIKAASMVLIAIATPANAESFTFDDIEFWVGNGANRAAIAIDWIEGFTEPTALVWGYRWDGPVRGRDMLTAIVTADTRLYAKLGGTTASPNAVYALGYDADNDGEFGVCDERDDHGVCLAETTFDTAGIAFTGPADGGTPTDADDFYAEGWLDQGFWHYGVASNNPYDGGSWTDFQFGMGSRVLTDGAWDSWTFEGTTVPPFDAYAESPTPAQAPGGRPGDFNYDGHIDADDYDEWRRNFGSTLLPAIDVSNSGVVDAADYVAWRKYAQTSGGSMSSPMRAPEPPAFSLASFFIATCVFFTRRKRKECD
jgi:hypothetical protein